MTEPEPKFLDRPFDSPQFQGHKPWWTRGATPIVVVVVLVAFVLSLLALALLI